LNIWLSLVAVRVVLTTVAVVVQVDTATLLLVN
jgi:hypothetical protein